MSDDVIIALVGLISAIGGALASNLYAAAKTGLRHTSWRKRCKPTTNAYGNGTAP